ncbi:MAG: TraI domain-containing protein [Neisseriaceae bacterium]|nr:TraI domain-containing protein [Neisseriaceae bacterium]
MIILVVAVVAVLFFLWQPEKDDSKEDAAPSPTTTQLPEFSGSRLRVLSADELIRTLDLQPVIDNIKIHSGLSTENWNKDGLPLIHNFLSLVQRLPASESHHHAGDGGLARHTLDVAALALRQAAGRSFPPNGKTEDIPRLTAVWKYGILVAALLHDVGKVLTGFKITLSDLNGKNQGIWLSDTGNMPINQYYTVDFLSDSVRYAEHAEIGWSFFKDLVPEDTRKWISNSSPDLIMLLRSYLSGKKDGSIIEELVKNADMASVSRDLATGSRQRFATARRLPLIEIILDTLQEMLLDKGRYFSIAKDAGGDLFRKGDTIYMIAKNVPDYIRDYLQKNNPNIGASFPTENSRIFDTLFEYRAILPNPYEPSKAITNIAVQFIKGGKTTVQTQFTVLAFNAKTLYPDGDYPTEFSGLLEVVEEKAIKSATNNEIETQAENSVSGCNNDNKIDTNNSQKEIENTNTDTSDNYVVPPIMANPFANNPPTQNKQEDDTDLSVLLNDDTNKKDSIHSNNLPKQDISSIDDLLSQTGVLEETEESNTEEETQVSEKNSATAQLDTVSEMPTVEHFSAVQKEEPDTTNTATLPETLSGSPKSRKQQNKEEKRNKLKALFADSSEEEETEAIQSETLPETALDKNNGIDNEMPRPVPVKKPDTLDNVLAAARNHRIRKALNGNAEEVDEFKRQGVAFLHWLADGLADGSVSFNTANSFVHFVEQGMLIISPAAFKHFTGEFNAKNPECLGVATQRSFQLLGIVRRSRRTALYRAFNPTGQALFLCFLIPDEQLHHLIQMSTRPANNPNLTIIPADEMFYKKDK